MTHGAAAATAAPLVASAVAAAPRLGSGPAWASVGLCSVATVAAGLRWLRVAQREHYLPGSVLRFAPRWWLGDGLDAAAAAAALGGAAASWWWPSAALATGAAVLVLPWGLSVRGRTARLVWTRRLRTLAATWAALSAGVAALGAVLGAAPVATAVVAVLVPLVVEAATRLDAPLERWLAGRHVLRAAERLSRVGPTVVAITGSYGKTSTKGLVAQLVGSARSLVASPASFNNRAGLARAVNEGLAEGTEVFVAEMGTYGVGEIAELCRFCRPDISVITAVGPVHLERFGSEDRILEAKSEILGPAGTVVLPVDDERLAHLADRSQAGGKRVIRCSTLDRWADICVERTSSAVVTVYVAGEPVAKDVPAPLGVQPRNLACAMGVVVALGLDPRRAAERIEAVQVADHRQAVARAPSGVVVVDDTYNSNPAGAASALDALCAAANASAPDGERDPADAAGGPGAALIRRLAVVTPGMVELGPRQFEENARFAADAARRATDLVVVGRTNRRALLAGAASEPAAACRVHRVGRREDAVAWVRRNLGPGDVVLYENDLPDHYP